MTETESEKVTWWHFHRRLYNWVIHFADTPHGRAGFVFAEFCRIEFFSGSAGCFVGAADAGGAEKVVPVCLVVLVRVGIGWCFGLSDRDVFVGSDWRVGVCSHGSDWLYAGQF